VLLKNQVRVKEEQHKALEERKKIEKLRREREEERELEALIKLQEAHGGPKRVQRVDWMYNGPSGEGGLVNEEREAFLLGKRRIDPLLKNEETKSLQKGAAAAVDTESSVANTTRDLASKVALDPLLIIKKQQMEATLKAAKAAAKAQQEKKKDEHRQKSRRQGDDRRRDRRDRYDDDRRSSRRHEDVDDRYDNDRHRSRRNDDDRERRHDHHRDEDGKREHRSRHRHRDDYRRRDRTRSRSPDDRDRRSKGHRRSLSPDPSRNSRRYSGSSQEEHPRYSSPTSTRNDRRRCPSPRRESAKRRRSQSPHRKQGDQRPVRAPSPPGMPAAETKPAESAAAKLARMQADAEAIEQERLARVREREAEDAAEEAKHRASDGGRKLMAGLHRQAGEMDLSDRLGRGRQGYHNDAGI